MYAVRNLKLNQRWLSCIIIMFLVATGALGCGTSMISDTQTSDKPDLEVINHSTESNELYTYIVGSVKNNTDKEYNSVTITINYYDSSGAQLGSALDIARNLEPGGIWKFRVCPTHEFASYKIKEVTGN